MAPADLICIKFLHQAGLRLRRGMTSDFSEALRIFGEVQGAEVSNARARFFLPH
jgi:hypothetical protein